MPAEALDKSAPAIRDMFADVAPRYDLLNHVLSAFLDRGWRRHTAGRAHRESPPGPVLDLCCGTGDQSAALARTGRRVVASDFCLPMLERARAKVPGRRGAAGTTAELALSDALAPPFRPASFAAVTVAFGARNVVDLDAAFGAIAELLAPGGRLFLLEFAMPEGAVVGPLYRFYFRRVLPAVGGLVSGRGAAYRYLRDSVLDFPQRRDLVRRLERAGLADAAWEDLTAGTVCLYTATRPAEPPA